MTVGSKEARMDPLLTRIIESQRTVLPSGTNPLADRQVAVVGLGSLGSLLAESVVRLGFGRVLLIDRDIVDGTNLHRQTLYDTEVLGKPKAIAAEQRLKKLGSKAELVPLVEHLSARNIERLLEKCDLVLCAVDNTAGRMVINQYCLDNSVLWAFGGAIGYRGEATLFSPPDGPCYACLFPDPVGIPKVDPRDCTMEGILVPTVMVVASHMVFLALADDPVGFTGRRFTFNGNTLHNADMRMPRNPMCPACFGGKAPSTDTSAGKWTVEFICGNAIQVMPHGDLNLDLRSIARRHAPAGADVTNWYLRFPWRASQEVFLWRNGRLVVTNSQGANEVVVLYRHLIAGGSKP